MRRTELQRKTPLVRYSALGREGQLSIETRRATPTEYARVNGLRRTKIKSLPRAGKARAWQPGWWTGEIRGTVCVVCEESPACQGHHIIPAQLLRREALRREVKLPVILWDRRNRLGVCPDCHANHHARSRPIRRSVLLRVAAWVFDFACEWGLEWALDREYPVEVACA